MLGNDVDAPTVYVGLRECSAFGNEFSRYPGFRDTRHIEDAIVLSGAGSQGIKGQKIRLSTFLPEPEENNLPFFI